MLAVSPSIRRRIFPATLSRSFSATTDRTSRPILLRVDIRDGQADDLLERVTEHAADGRISGQELPGLGVHNQNAVERTVEDRAELFLGLAQRLFGPLALGLELEVVECERQVQRH